MTVAMEVASSPIAVEGTVVFASTEGSLGLPGNGQWTKQLNQLMNHVPSEEKRIKFLRKPVPSEDKKYYWYVLTPAGLAALLLLFGASAAASPHTQPLRDTP